MEEETEEQIRAQNRSIYLRSKADKCDNTHLLSRLQPSLSHREQELVHPANKKKTHSVHKMCAFIQSARCVPSFRAKDVCLHSERKNLERFKTSGTQAAVL